MKSSSLSVLILALAISVSPIAAATVLVSAKPEAKIAYTNPVWSSNGRNIAYVSVPYSERINETAVGKSGKNIYLATLAAAQWKHRLLVKDADWPVWSPDARQIAFNRRGLAVMNLNTGNIRQLTKDIKIGEHKPGNELHYPLSWSPNGRDILYEIAYYEGSKGAIFDTKTGKTLSTPAGTSADWMSDNKLVSAYTPFVPPEVRVNAWLRITDPARNSFRTILKGISISGLHVIARTNSAWGWLRSSPPKGEGIYRIDLKTGELVKLLSVQAHALYWSPDGKSFALVSGLSQSRDEKPQYNVYAGNTRNWYFKSVAKDAAIPSDNWHDRMKYIGWSHDGRSLAYVTDHGDIKILKLASK